MEDAPDVARDEGRPEEGRGDPPLEGGRRDSMSYNSIPSG